jgi:hypothetical protein
MNGIASGVLEQDVGGSRKLDVGCRKLDIGYWI